ncbi:hypothetical protein [Shewanella sp. Shew256]|uniref:hypothetical protein n=1 Tax=Shewanella sp. Shew256 TaxID=1969376 RepID=UPI000B49CD8A|nr:hypothetical protein [Shewanella sp. Shew256]
MAERTGLEPATPGVTGRADMDFSALPILSKLLSIDSIGIICMTIGLNINDNVVVTVTKTGLFTDQHLINFYN